LAKSAVSLVAAIGRAERYALRYAVIGAQGQVGQEFAKLLAGDRMIALDVGDLDVADRASVERCLAPLEFDIVINLAAYHNVNECESNAARAFGVNAVGAFHVASVVRETGKKLVFFSSDYVFGGDAARTRPYVESDAPAPLNVYGASKAAGECLVRAVLPEDHLIVRTSSLYGCVTSKKGWTFPELMLNKAKAGEEIKIVQDQVMAPTYTRDLVRRVLELLDKGARGTFHVTNAGSCSWYEFAMATFDLRGVKARAKPVSSAEFPVKARRPAYSVLSTDRAAPLGLKPLQPWRDALRDYWSEKET
jgi:dTDP-4-dehydrorhamnose reductase